MKAPVKYLTVAATVLLMSCAAQKSPAPTTDRYIVTAMRTPFYHYGPAQPMGADFVLVKGQNVTLIKRSFGYSQIMTADGQSGYVGTEDIGPAPAPTPTPKPKQKYIPIPESEYEKYLPPPEYVPSDSVQPRNLEPPMGLPDADQEKPTFRY